MAARILTQRSMKALDFVRSLDGLPNPSGKNLSKYNVSGIRSAKLCAASCCSKSKPDISEKTKVLYDGDCPICLTEIKAARYLNRKTEKLHFVDITDPTYNPSDHNGISYKEAMDVFHVVDEHQKVHKGVDAMIKMYNDIGYGWGVNFLRWPSISSTSDRLYAWFAKNRLRLTRRKLLSEMK